MKCFLALRMEFLLPLQVDTKENQDKEAIKASLLREVVIRVNIITLTHIIMAMKQALISHKTMVLKDILRAMVAHTVDLEAIKAHTLSML